jgi:hypothetical protein
MIANYKESIKKCPAGQAINLSNTKIRDGYLIDFIMSPVQ